MGKKYPPLIEHEGDRTYWSNRIGSERKFATCLLCILQTRMYFCCLSMTHLKTGQRNIFMKNGFQIRIQNPRINFGANFQNFFCRFLRLRPTFWGTGEKSTNLRQSYSIIRMYHHTIGKVHTPSIFFKNVPPLLYWRCVWKTYTDEGLKR